MSLRAILLPDWIGEVTPTTVRADLFAGFTSATVVLPQAVAFAAIAGLPPQYGLYTAIVVPVIGAWFGSSRVMVSGPTLVISVLLFSTLATHAQPGSAEFVAKAIALTLLAGLFQLAFGVLRLGKLVNFVSHSVMVGFTAAAAVLITVSQLKDALGIAAPRGGSIIESVGHLLAETGSIEPRAVAIAAATLATLVGCRMLSPRLPAFIGALLVGSLAGFVLHAEGSGIPMVGALPSVVPNFAWPPLSPLNVGVLAEGAFAIALLGLLEAVAIGRAFALKTNRRFDADREITAQGLSNIGGSFFQSFAGSGSFTRSGVNYESGGKTPLAAIASSGFLLLVLLFVAPLFARIPVAAIAAVILYVAFRLVDFTTIRHILSTSPAEAVIVGCTFFAGLFVNLEFAIYGGVITSLVIFLSHTSRPALAVGAPDTTSTHRPFRNAALHGLPECPQTVFVRLDGPLYFGSVDYLEREFERFSITRPEQKNLVLVLRGVGDIDLPGAELIIQQTRRRRSHGGDLFIVARYPPLRHRLTKYHVTEVVGADHIFESKGEAIAQIVPRLDPDICARCSSRIFLECPKKPTVETEASDKPAQDVHLELAHSSVKAAR